MRCQQNQDEIYTTHTQAQIGSGAVGPMFMGGPRAVLFRQIENFFRQTKKFSGQQHFKSSPLPLPTTLTIFRRVSTIGPPPGYGATADRFQVNMMLFE